MSHKAVTKRTKKKALPVSGGAPGVGTVLSIPEQVEQRAYQLFESRSREHGFAVQDWLRAEQEVLSGRG